MARDKITPEKRKADFLAALREKYSVYHACQAVGISRQTAYRWRNEDEEFAKEWDDSKADAVDVLETSLYERAVKGDTVAAIFMLKGALPEKYKDRVANEHSGTLTIADLIRKANEQK